jgi:CYTH domain-containing protein
MEQFEIERKYLIRRPDEAYLRGNAAFSEIAQTYLLAKPGETERVRKRTDAHGTIYTHTVKQRLTAVRRIEREEEISAEEYEALLKRADPSAHTIEKQRWVLVYEGQHFELDIFPFWERQAYLELEISHEAQEIRFPPEITVLREVTEDTRYTNASLARAIPAEDPEGELT